MISVTNSDKGSFTMKFSTRDRYALRLMVELANRPNDLIPLKDISDKQRISLKYLEQIVTPLAKAGLVSSVRGAQGGYRLARPAGEITSGEILRAVEGELTAIPCLASSVDCPHRSQCHTLDFWSGLNDLINKYVDGITLEQLRTLRSSLRPRKKAPHAVGSWPSLRGLRSFCLFPLPPTKNPACNNTLQAGNFYRTISITD